VAEIQFTNLIKCVLLLLCDFSKFVLCFVISINFFPNSYRLENRAKFQLNQNSFNSDTFENEIAVFAHATKRLSKN